MDVIIRPYEVKDAVTLTSLMIGEFGYKESNAQQLIMRLRRFQVHPDYHTLVALDQREVIGFIGIHKGMSYEFDEEYIKINALAVKSSYQNSEVGNKLLEDVEAYARKRNIHRIVVEDEGLKDTCQFYKDRGYEVKGCSFIKRI
ncbi:GNAT family N-acetyltransferase [Niameybacter massiliensis]|uniref:GNAT family N-acetyltransferase n=1 Tax=Holtiella tumoricola TaxID=3018743 RepID=A0AA42J014_9FIRM|nr:MULTISPECIES: GNAT family N-acetyltransferase [Lachnospirales]MDA3730741.1 GNAT family N-acetyltransferase [Holtiella tumoricola]